MKDVDNNEGTGLRPLGFESEPNFLCVPQGSGTKGTVTAERKQKISVLAKDGF